MRANPLVIPAGPGARPRLEQHLIPALSTAILEGRVVVIFARNSGNGGRQARQACILDAQQVIGDLSRFGLDLTHLMPSAEDLDEWLRAAPAMGSKDARTGRAFSNRFVEVWLTPQTLLVLSIGTGSRMSEETLSQPFMDYVAQRVVSTVPVLLHGKRWDRLGRRKWGLGPALEAMKTSPPAFIGDEDRIERLDEASELRAFIAGDQAERFAEKIPRQTRRGMRSRTGSQMQDGYVPYAIPAPPPPGMCRLRMAGSGVGSNGEVRAYFESPALLPGRSAVALGYPNVLDPDTGQPVDQVDNVRWALQRLADPRWTLDRIGEGLVQRRFSHTRPREHHGLDTTCAPRSPKAEAARKKRYQHPYGEIVRPILSNLEFYETGILRRTLGVDGIDDIEITGLIPPDGPWAPPETFAAIRRRRSERIARRGKSAMLLSRLPVTINGIDAVLQGHPASRQQPCYGFWDRAADVCVPAGITIDHADLAQLVAEALDHAARTGLALPAIGQDGAGSPELEQAGQAVRALRLRLQEAHARRDRLYQRMDTPDVLGPLLARLAHDYNEIELDTIPALQRQIEAAEADLRRVEQVLLSQTGVEPDRLDALVRALASPWRSDARPEIFALIHSLQITTERVCPHRHFRGYRAHLRVELALTDADGTPCLLAHEKSIPLTGLRRYQQAIEHRRDMLRDGIPAAQHKPAKGASISTSELPAALGLQEHQRCLVHAEDPRLLRLAFAVVEASQAGAPDPAEAITAIAASLGEPEALVARCWNLYGPQGTKTGRWQRRLRPADRTPRPCQPCGTTRLWPLIDEITGGVCPACRQDEAGITWPTHYDQWLTNQPRYLDPKQAALPRSPKASARPQTPAQA
ncbi:MAG: hypothetical protein KGP12_01220 [Actinomycetales bacterium]|nr:hypothetical protein [Actinomycetales bacterium]